MKRSDLMKIGDVYSRKDYEYTVVSRVEHAHTGGYVYMIQQRLYGQDEVTYYTQLSHFGKGYTFIRNELED